MTVKRTERKEWAREHFRGFENVLMPSFDPQLKELDEEGIRLDVRQSIAHGFFSSLCSVESGLTVEEKKRFMEVAADEARERISIGFSLTGDSWEENFELLDHAEKAGLSHALLSYPQSFVPKSQDEIYQRVAELCESTNLGVYIFVADKFGFQHLHPSGVPFDAYARLVELPNVVAMKLGGMDPGMIHECFERFGDKALVTTVNLGMIPMLAQLYGVQWSGAWTVEALQSPEKRYCVEIFEAVLDGRTDDAMKIYWRLAPALGVMLGQMAPLVPTGMYHWPQLKFYQWCTGGNGGYTRQPVMRLFQRDMDAIRNGYRAIGITPADDDDEFAAGRTAYARLRGAAV